MSNLQEALARLKTQAAMDRERPWKPGQRRTDAQLLWQHIQELERDLSLEKDDSWLRNWATNPDRMGGQFAPEEYEQLKRSEQGIFG